MAGIEIKTRTKEEILKLKHNIAMLKSLPKDMLIGVILGINEEKSRRQ